MGIIFVVSIFGATNLILCFRISQPSVSKEAQFIRYLFRFQVAFRAPVQDR